MHESRETRSDTLRRRPSHAEGAPFSCTWESYRVPCVAIEELTMTRARRNVSMLALVSAIVLTAAACHKKVAPPAPAPPPPPAVTPAPPPPASPPAPPSPAPRPSALTEEQIFAQKSLEQLNAEHPLQDVYFDLDKSELREDAKAPLQRDADWLKKWGSTSSTIEGHCDSRGSAEYNLALGARRANA